MLRKCTLGEILICLMESREISFFLLILWTTHSRILEQYSEQLQQPKETFFSIHFFDNLYKTLEQCRLNLE